MSHYSPGVVFESPRVAAAYSSTGCQVGSPDGVLVGVDSLRPYFAQGIAALPALQLTWGKLLQGPPGGWYALEYTRETGATVIESFLLGPPAAKGDGGQDLQGTSSRRPLITHVRVFYESVC
ncbi:hypothetical protein HYH03_010076 [Edaphochlamys debaryana]|uniref:Uncharacterized protein n=1 Tax=Edaphochlamys debaryana TaxID=47281 RepID=A0A835XYR7_9CHLO|nr:hypothetical protein HYH03_010076 [Edaphochlamys debaryana]|eukprot:KAG2491498.1 hypothetical protein HYH03_010076 [Edaphochlamys debaryana]